MKKSVLAGTSIVVVIGVYAVLALFGDVERTLGELASLALGDWAVILGLSLVNYAVRFLRWERYVFLASGVSPGRWRHVLVYVGGFALTTTPGKAGEAIRSYYLRDDSVPVTASLSALGLERIMDLLAIALLAALLAGGSPPFHWLIPAAIAAAFLVILLLRGVRPAAWAQQAAERCHGWLHRLLLQIRDLLSNARSLMRPTVAAASLAAGLFAWGCEGLGLAYVLQVLGADLSVAWAVGVYALAMLVGALSFVPGGLGSTEVAMTLLLAAGGAPLEVSVAATMICRVATLWFAVLLGVAALLFLPRSGSIP